MRGARRADGRAVHLLAALDHGDGVVFAQRVVDGKSRTVKMTEVSTGIRFPHARLALQITRSRDCPYSDPTLLTRLR